MDCFQKNRKDTTGEQEEQVNYGTLISKSSRRAKQGGKTVAMAWIGYKNAYSMVPEIWIIEFWKHTKYQQIYKLHHGSHEKLEIGINSARKNFSRGENPERHLPGKCTFVITICYSNDVTHLQEIHWGLQLYKITWKDKSLYALGGEGDLLGIVQDV